MESRPHQQKTGHPRSHQAKSNIVTSCRCSQNEISEGSIPPASSAKRRHAPSGSGAAAPLFRSPQSAEYLQRFARCHSLPRVARKPLPSHGRAPVRLIAPALLPAAQREAHSQPPGRQVIVLQLPASGHRYAPAAAARAMALPAIVYSSAPPLGSQSSRRPSCGSIRERRRRPE